MSWNYRVIRNNDTFSEYYYSVHRVDYDVNGEIVSWSKNAQSLTDTTINGLDSGLKRISAALNKPVLEEFEGKLVEVE